MAIVTNSTKKRLWKEVFFVGEEGVWRDWLWSWSSRVKPCLSSSWEQKRIGECFSDAARWRSWLPVAAALYCGTKPRSPSLPALQAIHFSGSVASPETKSFLISIIFTYLEERDILSSAPSLPKSPSHPAHPHLCTTSPGPLQSYFAVLLWSGNLGREKDQIFPVPCIFISFSRSLYYPLSTACRNP